MSRLQDMLAGLEKAGKAGEDAVLVLVLGSMILTATAQIVLRNFFDFGFIWADELLRMMVLWIAVAGAVAASRSDKHINIAILDRYLPPKLTLVTRLVVHAFTAAVCALITRYCYEFVKTSHEYGDVLLGSVPAWMLQAILPVGFALITWRYALFTLKELAGLFRPGAAQ